MQDQDRRKFPFAFRQVQHPDNLLAAAFKSDWAFPSRRILETGYGIVNARSDR